MQMQSEKIAKVLEASAKYTEALEKENKELKDKLAQVSEREKQAKVQPVLERIEELTGESLPDEVKEKLANDDSVLDLVGKIARDSDVEPVGDVSREKTASAAPMSADEKFGVWATGE
jgi:seryl-tRNA synthetase